MHEVIGSIMATSIHSHGLTLIIKFIHDTSFFTDEQTHHVQNKSPPSGFSDDQLSITMLQDTAAQSD